MRYVTKIRNYKEQDLKAGRIIDEEAYVTVQDILRLMRRPICYHCQIEMTEDNLTLDRIDDDLPHNTNNCVLACIECNNAHKNKLM